MLSPKAKPIEVSSPRKDIFENEYFDTYETIREKHYIPQNKDKDKDKYKDKKISKKLHEVSETRNKYSPQNILPPRPISALLRRKNK